MGGVISYNDGADALDGGGVNGAITVTTSASEAKVGASAQTNRKTLLVYNNGTDLIYFGFSNAVTTSNGMPIAIGQLFSIAVGPNTPVWLIAASGSQNVRVAEVASV